jgi:hypothetical protein
MGLQRDVDVVDCFFFFFFGCFVFDKASNSLNFAP